MGRHETTDAAAKPAGMRFELALDLRLALAALQDDEVLEEPRFVVLERLHLDRPAGAAARRQEAMTVGVRAGPDVLHRWSLRQLRAPNDERHDAPAVEQDEPPYRTGEHQVALVVLEIG